VDIVVNNAGSVPGAESKMSMRRAGVGLDLKVFGYINVTGSI